MAGHFKHLYAILKLTILSQIIVHHFANAVFYTSNSHNDFPTLGKRQDAAENTAPNFIPPNARYWYTKQRNNEDPFLMQNKGAMNFRAEPIDLENNLDTDLAGNGRQFNHGLNWNNDIEFLSKLNELQRRLRMASDYALLDNNQLGIDSNNAGSEKRKVNSYEARNKAWMAMSPWLQRRSQAYSTNS